MDERNIFAVARGELFDCLEKLKKGVKLSESEAAEGEALFDEFLDFCMVYNIIDNRPRKTRDFFCGAVNG